MKDKQKNNTKLIITIVVAIIFVIQLCVPFLIIKSNAGDEVTVVQTWDISATTSDNVTAKLYSDGELVISGTGKMINWLYSISPFHKNTDIKTIKINENVENVGGKAFALCSNVTNIEIQRSVTDIGPEAFCFCTGLTSITIPSSVTEIGENAFQGCSNLASIQTYKGLRSIGRGAFAGCSLTNVEIPSSVQNIGEYAFLGCSSLTNIKLPTGISIIHRGTFYECSNLSNIEMPSNLYEIGIEAFYGCSNLKNIEIPSNVFWINYGAFTRCSSLTSITIPKNAYIGDYAFQYCYNLKDVEIKLGVANIGKHAFDSCGNLTNITIPESVTSIGEFAFSYCGSLTSIKIPESIKSIEKFTFSGCSSLTSIEIPNSVTNIGRDAFDGCSSLKNIKIPNGVTTISERVFINCSSLEKIEIPEGVTGIEPQAFIGCSNLKTVTIPSTIKEIENESFNCDALENVIISEENLNYCSKDGVIYNKEGESLIFCPRGKEEYNIPEGVTSIKKDAFFNFTGLQSSISIPDSVTNIEENAFAGGNYIIYCNPNNTYLVNYIKGNNLNMDNTGPEITFDKNGNNTYIKNQEVMVTVTHKVLEINEDSLCYAISESNTETPEFTNKFVLGEPIKLEKPEGKYYLWIKAQDELKNEAIIYSNIYYLDSSLEEGEMKWDISATTDDNVTATLSTNGKLIISGTGNTDIDKAYELSQHKSQVNNVRIEQGVTNIEDYAFEGCINLISITMPEGITRIGEGAFANCSSLTSIIIPKNVTYIGESAFVGCSNLMSINTEPNNQSYASDGGVLFNKLKTTLIQYPAGKENATYNIPEETTNIGFGAFAYANNLVKIEIPSSIKTIAPAAFGECRKLESIRIPEGITKIEDFTFYKDTGLRNLIIPNSVTSIGEEEVFSDCNNLTIYCNDDTKDWITNNNIVSEKINNGEITIDTTGPTISLDKNGNNSYNKSELVTVTVEKEIVGINENELYYAISNSNTETPEFINKFILGDTIKLENLTGTYYLWIKAKTKGLENETILYSNPFYLDNSIPQVAAITGETEDGKYMENLTNKDVTISIEKGIETLSGTSRLEYTINNGESWTKYDENNKPKIANEGITRIKARAVNGAEIEGEEGEEFIVKIDKTAPDVTIEISNNGEVSKTKTMKITAEDKECSLNLNNEYRYCITTNEELTGTEEWLEYTIGKEYTIGENLTGEYYIHLKPIKDELGNESNVVRLNKMEFDNKAPEVTVYYMEISHEKETAVIITSDEELEKVEGWYYFLNDKKIIVKVYEENKEEEITAKDKLGNRTTVKVKVDSIAKEPEPTGEFRYTKQTEGEKNYILEVSPETTLENFRTNIGNKQEAQVQTEDEKELTEGQYVGTGMTVEIEETKYTIVVKGDSYKGDGIVNTFDLLAMFYHKVYAANEEENEYKLSEEKLKAADINKNGGVDSIDLLKVFYHKERIGGYSL